MAFLEDIIGPELRWLLSIVRPSVRLYLTSLAAMAIGSLMLVVDPLILKWLIDTALSARTLPLLALAGLLLFIVSFVRFSCQSLSLLVTTRAVQATMIAMRAILVEHLSTLSAAYYDRTLAGDVIFVSEQDVTTVAELSGELLMAVAQTSLGSTLILVVLFALNWRMACLILPFIPLFILVRRRYHCRLQCLSHDAQSRSAARVSFLEIYLAGMNHFQLLLSQPLQISRYKVLAEAAGKAEYSRRKAELKAAFWSLTVMLAGMGTLVMYGTHEVAIRTLTIGGLVATYTYVARLFDPFSDAIDIHARLIRIRASVRRLLEILTSVPAIHDAIGAVTIRRSALLSLDVRNVSFGYHADRLILQDISLKVTPGYRLAISGRTGSGKSTLIKLIVRMYDPYDGVILIGGTDIRNVTLRSLRSVIAIVPQDPFVFTGSLRDNIICANPSANQSAIERVIEIAQLSDVIRRFRRGWEEPIGANGATLSGGERQRIAIARALLRSPTILILDECTSALDSDTETRLLRALAADVRKAATLIVSHRQSVFAWADEVVTLENGSINVARQAETHQEATW